MNRFNVVFRGEFLPEYDIDAAKDKLAEIFKLDPATVEKLFSGQSVTVRKGLDETTARKYKTAAAGCGVVFELEAQEPAPETEPTLAPPDFRSTTTQIVTCPECGESQSLSNTCIRCGAFLIRAEAPARPDPIPRVTVAMSTAKANAGGHRGIFKTLRIAALLLVLLVVGLNTVMSGRWATNWDDPVWVGIYPINADDSEAVSRYIGALEDADFQPVATFFAKQAEAHELPLAEPFRLLLAPEVKALPPEPPTSGNPVSIIIWSLKMRWWVFSHDTFKEGPSPEIKIFVLYHGPESPERLENSLGLRKGMFGVVHAYADIRLESKNHVVIAHEILHTLGASDKYDLATGQPIYPDGFAHPEREPRYPQQGAEIMGGRIPLSPTQSTMPPNLNYTVIGSKTAREIKWRR